jgi:YD repeat-containing protein
MGSCRNNTGYGGENYYLEKAVFSGKYEVNFQYDELLGTKITRYHRYENLVSTSANIEENDINKYNADFYYPRYLKTITTPNFTITFNRDTREDINGEERLESILITDNQGNDKLITFHNESYFATASNETVGAYYSSHNGVPSSPKRLKLDGVTITANNSEEPKVYSFDYNPEPLPSKASYARDYWGYYNGSLGNSRLIPNMDKIYGFDKDMYFEIPPGLRTAGSNRAADEHFMQAGILTSVTFPTGGKTIFEYEAHKFENYYLEEANIEVISGNVNPSSPGTAQRSPILSFDRPTQLTINAGISYGGAPSDSPYTKYETIKHSYVKLINLTNGTETKLIDPIDLAYDVCDFDDDPNNLPHCEEYAGYPGFKINGYKIIVDEGDFQIEVYKSDSSTVYCSESAYYSYKQKQPYSVGGGLRVKSITSLKNGSPTLKKEYIYNGDELGLGHLMVKPTYFKKETKFYMEGLVPTRDWYSLGSNSNIALKDYASGGQVGYANVREKFVDCIDPNKTYYIDHIYNLHPPLISNFSEMAPPVMQADNGLEYRTEFYDNNDNLVKSIANGYDIDYTGSYAGVFGENFTAEMPVNEVCFAFHQMNYSRGSQYGQLKAHFYSIPVYSIDKTHTLSTTYLNDQLEVSEFKSFEYNYLKQLVKTTTENSKGEKITEITYPFDTVKNGSNNIFNDMYLNNALAKPVQVKEYNNGKLLNKINYNYAEYQNSSTGESTFKSTSKAIDFPGTTDLDNKVNYIYNAEGVLIQANKENDIVTSLIWGHAGKTKLLAKLENITYDNIPVDVITKLEEFDDTDITTKLDIVNSFIRSHESMKDALVTTYTYNLLHGVSTITDPRGRTTYYKYDSMGRLWRILDHDKNVIEQYEYNYRQ